MGASSHPEWVVTPYVTAEAIRQLGYIAARNSAAAPAVNIDTEAAIFALKTLAPPGATPHRVNLLADSILPEHELIQITRSGPHANPSGQAYHRAGVSYVEIGLVEPFNQLIVDEDVLHITTTHELQHAADFSDLSLNAAQEAFRQKAARHRRIWNVIDYPLRKAIDKLSDQPLDPRFTTGNYVYAKMLSRKSPWERRAYRSARLAKNLPKVITFS